MALLPGGGGITDALRAHMSAFTCCDAAQIQESSRTGKSDVSVVVDEKQRRCRIAVTSLVASAAQGKASRHLALIELG